MFFSCVHFNLCIISDRRRSDQPVLAGLHPSPQQRLILHRKRDLPTRSAQQLDADSPPVLSPFQITIFSVFPVFSSSIFTPIAYYFIFFFAEIFENLQIFTFLPESWNEMKVPVFCRFFTISLFFNFLFLVFSQFYWFFTYQYLEFYQIINWHPFRW